MTVSKPKRTFGKHGGNQCRKVDQFAATPLPGGEAIKIEYEFSSLWNRSVHVPFSIPPSHERHEICVSKKFVYGLVGDRIFEGTKFRETNLVTLDKELCMNKLTPS
mmetsp:Transcript_1433/g.1498  ORF Transcript_1433/g.1498 Transcript_1433/m.1498 type:complete len:106 (-) Transcript_1433:456-773(-)